MARVGLHRRIVAALTVQPSIGRPRRGLAAFMGRPPGEDALVVPDIGVGGPGPDRVPIPEVAQPGEYRICTGNAGVNFCTPIEIAAP